MWVLSFFFFFFFFFARNLAALFPNILQQAQVLAAAVSRLPSGEKSLS